MSTSVILITCRLVGGPFDGTDCDELFGMQAIKMRAGPGEHYAIYGRPKPDVITDDGRTVFNFDSVIEQVAD
jgi:hypothetical protein